MEEQSGSVPVARKNKHDIVGSLPLELVVQVIEHLDMADVVRNQRVSKRWRTIFSSDPIIKTKISLTRTLAALGMETEHAKAEAMFYFRWLYGLEFARPVKKVFLPWLQFEGKINQIVYHSRRLCYAISERDGAKVVMLNLETGRRSVWANDAGHYLQEVILSDRYLVIVSYASPHCVLLAWDIHTSQRLAERRFLWFPSSVIVDKDKAVIIPGAEWRSHPVFVWDLSTDRLQEFGSFTCPDLWHVDADENVVVMFEIDWDKRTPEVQQSKWSLSCGEQLGKKQFRLSVAGRRVDRNTLRRSFNDRYCTRGYKVTSELFYSEDYPCSAVRLTYDHAVDRLSLGWIDCNKPVRHDALPNHCDSLAPHIIYRSQYQLWGIVVYNTASDTATVHPYELDAREVKTANSLGLLPGSRETIFKYWSFGDRELFGVATDDGIQFWLFNPDFVLNLPDAEPFVAMELSR